MKPSKEEIRLCKEIARRYRKPPRQGDWVFVEKYKNYFLVVGVIRTKAGNQFEITNEEKFWDSDYDDKQKYFPLWTWEDAREWLRKKGFVYITLSIQTRSSFISASTKLVVGKRKVKTAFGATSLEAILKVVLAVLKEVKNESYI
ncbi:MAG: hypothetical protein ACTSPV_00535 [Candidatus Hodarchaeales archaeon]